MTNNRVDKASANPLSLESAVSPFPVPRLHTRRNFSLTLGILTVLICTALTFTACPEDSPSGDSSTGANLEGSTFTVKPLNIHKGSEDEAKTAYISIFGGTAPEGFTSINKRITAYTKADLTAKFAAAEEYKIYPYEQTYSYSELLTYQLNGNMEKHRTAILDALKTKGACTAEHMSGTEILVQDFFRD